MQLPLEVVFRNVDRTPEIEDLVAEHAQRLHQYAEDVIACRVAVEQRGGRHQTGNPWRVRIDLTMAPRRELVVTKEAWDRDAGLAPVVRDAFETMARQLDEFVDQRRNDIKTHQEPLGIVRRMFRDAGYGFLEDQDGAEVYFHRNSVLHGDWDRITEGSAVRFDSELGEKGPQATSVQVLDVRPMAAVPGAGRP
jgi:cold shock CspA family protein